MPPYLLAARLIAVLAGAASVGATPVNSNSTISSDLSGRDSMIATAELPAPGSKYRLVSEQQATAAPGTCSQDITLINECAGGSRGECQGTVTAYIYGLVSVHAGWTFMRPDSQFFPLGAEVQEVPQDQVAIRIPEGGRVDIRLPDCMSSGRIVSVANGDALHFSGSKGEVRAPSEVNPSEPSHDSFWSFMELTLDPNDGLTVNPSQVDSAGIPVAVELEHFDGDRDPVVTGGMKADAVATICEKLATQALADGQPWDKLCHRSNTTGAYVRASSPMMYINGGNPTAFQDYYEPYIDQVWEQYRNQDLVFDVGSSGNHTFRVGPDDQLRSVNSTVSFSKPCTRDIFTCATGPFTENGDPFHNQIVARLCAAFVRSTIHTGHVQPSDALPHKRYYQGNPSNHYAKFVHEVSKNGKGYAFPVDWVDGPSVADKDMPHGQITIKNPGRLTVTIGGWR
ncbi:Glucan endo-1,3-beta-glucosidase [Fulvia fulva]|uniref:Glucan endo-1,3-beta-glucosidase n=1 Tax=Passalora fulva TaxID=5499 RepID=A0A9Q8LGK9_PASFU|nr:Glucan endo-1,3-beta-glucosidase [Fulvia fulva]KAK4617381.1 Glucan endo-1,3-beta-glucosidase [Fulvia fulva]UJO17036.1 Glucan endo-1,3-beta-glucosidase [Fulvia fulva]